jgi:hypothetical protein
MYSASVDGLTSWLHVNFNMPFLDINSISITASVGSIMASVGSLEFDEEERPFIFLTTTVHEVQSQSYS